MKIMTEKVSYFLNFIGALSIFITSRYKGGKKFHTFLILQALNLHGTKFFFFSGGLCFLQQYLDYKFEKHFFNFQWRAVITGHGGSTRNPSQMNMGFRQCDVRTINSSQRGSVTRMWQREASPNSWASLLVTRELNYYVLVAQTLQRCSISYVPTSKVILNKIRFQKMYLHFGRCLLLYVIFISNT